MKVKLSLIPILSILLYFACIIKFAYYSNYNVISLALGAIIFVYLITKKNILNSNKTVNLCLFIFCVFALLSSIVNGNNFKGSFLFCLKVIDIFLFVEYIFIKNYDKKAVKIWFYLSLLINIYTLYYTKIHPNAFWFNDLNYFIGSKFTVAYNSLFTVVFYMYAYGKSKNSLFYKLFLILLLAIAYYTCTYVKCSTGIIGLVFISIFIVALNFSSSKKKSLLYSPLFSINIIVFSALFALIFSKYIVNIPIIKFIITDVLGKSSDLTGRLTVYKNIVPYFKNHFLFGYGFNNVYDIFFNTMQIGVNAYALDAQNSLLEYFLYFGLFGCVSFLFLIYESFKKFSKNIAINYDKNKSFLIGFYLLIFLGTVEITFNYWFFLFLAFLACAEIKKMNIDDQI